ncbi:hypothetical protein [Vibrio pacinii]|uniref:hypothetical protein n=1 Tax=Vibrio pacinii TaxID=170674 RepID=UPI001FDF41CA|nr:hypothetical protein [Vibrio pacinii]
MQTLANFIHSVFQRFHCAMISKKSIQSVALLLASLLPFSNASAQTIFEQYGIPNHLPKYGISSLTQGDHIVEHVEKVTTIDGDASKSSFYLVQTTDDKGIIDLRVKYFPDQLSQDEDGLSLVDDGDVIDSIEYLSRTEYKLRQYADSYDQSSVVVKEIDDKTAIVSFNYSKYALPQDVAYFRFMKVDVHVIDRQPQKMVIVNSAPFEYGRYIIENYHQEIIFDKLSDGSLYVKTKAVTAKGTFKGKPAKLEVTTTPVVFYDDVTGIEVKNEELFKVVSDPRIREKKIELNRTFPIMADLVRKQGIDLPLPYGFSVAYRNQAMDLGFETFNLGLGEIGYKNLDKDFDPSKSFATVSAESISLRGDVFILPFWNVYALLGKIKVRADIDAEYTAETLNDFRDENPIIGGLACRVLAKEGLPLCERGRLGIPLYLDYDLVGVGTTLAIGYREFFATLNATVSQTRLEGQSEWGEPLLVVQPMLGYQLVDYRAQILVGAEYQGLDSRLSGNLGYVDELGGDFEYDVGVKINEWAYLIGFNKQLGRHYNVTALYNKGETRESVTISLGYRF